MDNPTFFLLICILWATCILKYQAWYAEFLLEIDLKTLLRKTGARLNFKIALISLHLKTPEGKLSVTKFEFWGSFGMTLEGDCHKVQVTPYLELLVTFGVSLEGVIHNLTTSLCLIWSDQKFLEKSSLLIRYEKIVRLEWPWSLVKNLLSDSCLSGNWTWEFWVLYSTLDWSFVLFFLSSECSSLAHFLCWIELVW
jgi:hypothetical protein